MRLVVPAMNFTDGFPKLGYKGIKRIFDNSKVNYSKNTTIQAKDLVDTIKRLKSY